MINLITADDIMCINLQLFADGGDGSSGGADGSDAPAVSATQNKGSKNPLANVVYGKQATDGVVESSDSDSISSPATQNQTEPTFDELIKGKYKADYDKRMQDTIQKRLKGTQATIDRYNSLQPTLQLLANKYGVSADMDGNYDIELLNKAITDDDSYYEDEALEKGMSVEQLKQVKAMERENAQLKAQMQERQTREKADALYAEWIEQGNATAQIYPSFNMEAEMQNSKFTDLLRAGIDVRTAFEVIHKDDIIPAAMQFTAKTVEQKLSNKIASQGRRPAENGTSGNASAITKTDVKTLTKADRQEIARRVARGERISF